MTEVVVRRSAVTLALASIMSPLQCSACC